MPPQSCSFIRVSDRLSEDYIQERVRGYESTREVETLEGQELLTTVNIMESNNHGQVFQVEYDFPQKISVRGQEDPQYVKATAEVKVNYMFDLFSDGIALFGNKQARKSSFGRLAELLEVDPDALEDLSILPQTIADILREDSEHSRYKWWVDIDEVTDAAAIQGAVEDSSYAQQFDARGLPTWVVFDSSTEGRTIGLSTGSLMFYETGEGTIEAMVGYFKREILPRMSI